MPVDTKQPLSAMTRDDLLAEGWRLGIDFNTMNRSDTANLRILIEERRKEQEDGRNG